METPEKCGTPAQGNTLKKGDSESGWTAYCDKCGRKFDSRDAVEIPYSEYGEGLENCESASPCCGADFSDRPFDEDEQ